MPTRKASDSKGGSIHFYAVDSGTPPSHGVVTGAIEGAGTSRPSAAGHGRVQLNTVSLPNGTLVLDTTKLGAAVAKGLDAGDPTTCSAVFTSRRAGDGSTGHRGLHGRERELTLKVSVAAVAPKGGNGRCGAVSLVDWVRGAGNVSFK